MIKDDTPVLIFSIISLLPQVFQIKKIVPPAQKSYGVTNTNESMIILFQF